MLHSVVGMTKFIGKTLPAEWLAAQLPRDMPVRYYNYQYVPLTVAICFTATLQQLAIYTTSRYGATLAFGQNASQIFNRI